VQQAQQVQQVVLDLREQRDLQVRQVQQAQQVVLDRREGKVIQGQGVQPEPPVPPAQLVPIQLCLGPPVQQVLLVLRVQLVQQGQPVTLVGRRLITPLAQLQPTLTPAQDELDLTTPTSLQPALCLLTVKLTEQLMYLNS
jgi:hypothetical protein